MKGIRLAMLYSLFCLISMGANIGVQLLVHIIYSGPQSLFIAMLFGTGAGLITKYILDRNWIFEHHSTDLVHETRTAMLYIIMGIVTTLVFWTVEWSFDHMLGTNYRYLGAAVGLSIGYVAKYFLDRRFVFTSVRAPT